MRVLIAGGGTGGHINPALAIASIVKEYDPYAKFLFAGTPFGMEAKLVPQAGYDFEPIKVSGFQRKLTLKNIKRNLKTVAYLTTADRRARQIINAFAPDVVIGTGGYVSGPVVRAAANMGIPTAIHEQNAYPGLTNKLLSKKVDRVMLTVKEALNYMDKDVEYTVTGLPVRAEILNISKEEARRRLGFDDKMCILSFGGSLGAGCINDSMQSLIQWHVENQLEINHIHGYGGMGKETFPQAMKNAGIPLKSNRLRITEYIDDMDVCLAAADLVICRSGAATLAEIQAIGRASILIPSPIVAGNHQFHNAMVLGNAGAAIVIEQSDVTNDGIIKRVERLYRSPEILADMSAKARSLHMENTRSEIWNVISSIARK